MPMTAVGEWLPVKTVHRLCQGSSTAGELQNADCINIMSVLPRIGEYRTHQHHLFKVEQHPAFNCS